MDLFSGRDVEAFVFSVGDKVFMIKRAVIKKVITDYGHFDNLQDFVNFLMLNQGYLIVGSDVGVALDSHKGKLKTSSGLHITRDAARIVGLSASGLYNYIDINPGVDLRNLAKDVPQETLTGSRESVESQKDSDESSNVLTTPDAASSLITIPDSAAKNTTKQGTPKQGTIPKVASAGASGTQQNESSMDEVIRKAITAIKEISRDPSFYEYQGFDPLKMQERIVKTGKELEVATFEIDGSRINFHGKYVANDIAFLVSLGLMRGNNVDKMKKNSTEELVAILNDFVKGYHLRGKVSNSQNIITLMRVVASFPTVAYNAASSGRARNMVPELTDNLALSQPVCFQMVKRQSFGLYAAHFLTVAYKIDKIISTKPTDIIKLWNYMILGYTSLASPESKRLANIGEVKTKDLSLIQADASKLDAITAKIAKNAPERI